MVQASNSKITIADYQNLHNRNCSISITMVEQQISNRRVYFQLINIRRNLTHIKYSFE